MKEWNYIKILINKKINLIKNKIKKFNYNKKNNLMNYWISKLDQLAVFQQLLLLERKWILIIQLTKNTHLCH